MGVNLLLAASCSGVSYTHTHTHSWLGLHPGLVFFSWYSLLRRRPTAGQRSRKL